MYNPVATYRLQLHKEFNFSQLLSVLDYLHALGVITLYASPVFKSVTGSTHGYDGLDPNIIDPEIGDLEQLENISQKLRERGMGWLQDVVPNHMAFHSGNSWLMDVLEKGDASRYKKYFDIIRGADKIMVPFLGCTTEEAIEKDELQIGWNDGRLVLKYFDSCYPLNAVSYSQIIRLCCQEEEAMLIASRIDGLQGEQASEEWDTILNDLRRLQQQGNIMIDVDAVNADRGIVQHIIDQQYYRLCHWRETDTQINYRRFFTVNGLICMNVQDAEVFQHYHQLIKTLTEKEVFQGLRVDHADGLYDPAEYLRVLREMAGSDTYIVIEKILGKNEILPDWNIEGNTGYDFLSIINNLFANRKSERILSRFYSGISNSKKTIEEQIREKKSSILYQHMQGELNNLVELFRELQLASNEELENVSVDSIKTVIGSVLVNLPVYRFYGNAVPLSEVERKELTHVFRLVRHTESEHVAAAILLENILLDRPGRDADDYRSRASHFYKRLMQFSGPLMAKGVEDTLMYTYNRLLSRNEVGDTPESFGIDVNDFHTLMIKRWEGSPLSLNATATHDTKRGEDARARLNVITDLPEEWTMVVKEWMQMNAPLKQNGAPDRNDEYLIYQAILSSYPLDPLEEKNFPERLKAYLQKALREAKTNSNWSEPNEQYEQNVFCFADALLDPANPFWQSFRLFLDKITEHGVVNSLVQLVCKFTAPGVPDIYQGCELWDFSFVDPDNRSAVDYENRNKILQQVLSNGNVRELWESRHDGRIKLWLTHKLLQLRKEYADIFTSGEYVPIGSTGKYANNVIAYGRRLNDTMLIVVLPLHTASITSGSILHHDWEDTKIVLPEGAGSEVVDLLNEAAVKASDKLLVSQLFGQGPFGIFQVATTPKKREAGVLLHISSLPSKFGIGDLGPEATTFVDFLHRGSQKLWQVLPLNPTSEGQAHSPYSATSSMAGNPLFISPELLLTNGWIEKGELESENFGEPDRVSFAEAEKRKNQIFSKAWQRWKESDQEEFRSFCEREASWLHDFALYTLLKDMHEGKAWNEWQNEWKMRNPSSLAQISVEQGEKLTYIKWLQFIFHQQWSGLKRYANSKGIRIVGDLPFYVSYDSADVWVNRDLFSLDENGGMISVAGVPPDAFSEDGQLWGMPVFNWEKLRETNYKWWVERIRKNSELFDWVRLDHFRAFSAYWQVEGEEITAKNGKWVKAPGKELFETFRSSLGSLPFIAEDLGDIDEPVKQLRKEFDLPGMKVLQFAFGDHFGSSEFMPHHHEKKFVVYTGTHDNNTVRGWWETEAGEETRKRVTDYAGMQFNAETIPDYFCGLAYSSVADQVIIPMQDIIGLGGEARMNRPSSIENNWSWRLLSEKITQEVETKLRRWTRIYNR